MSNRPDVELVTEAIREIRPDGMVTADSAEALYGIRIVGYPNCTSWSARTPWSSGGVSSYLQADGRNVMLWLWTTVRYWWKTRRLATASYQFGHVGDALHEAPGSGPVQALPL